MTLWSDSGSNEQRWLIASLGNGQYLRSVIDPAYGLNVYRSGSPYNCNIKAIVGNETDAAVNITCVGNGWKIKLTNYDLYLTVGASANGTNVYWAAPSSSSYQLWNLTEL